MIGASRGSAALSFAVVLWAVGARAGAPRVDLDRGGLSTSVAAQIQAEAEALGFEVADPSTPPSPDAAASVRAVAGGVEVSVRGRRTLVPIDPALGPDDATVAIRTVELLRASLFVRAPAPPAPPPAGILPRAAPPAAAPAVPRAAPAAPRFTVEAAAAILASPGGLTAAPALLLGARWRGAEPFGVGAFVLLPVLPARVSGAEGSAALRPFLVGAGPRLGARFGRWIPAAELGLGAAWLHTTGEGNAPYVGRTDDRVAAVPYARAALALELGPRFALRAELLAGVALPPPRVGLADRVAARWGMPLWAPSIGCEVALP
jgi:hypothetical protein